MKLSEFDYHLPKSQIAQYPLKERDSSRLFVLYKKLNKFEHRVFRDIVEYLRPGDVLVLNDTKVIPARLYGVKPSGGRAEILLLKELRPNTWQALVKGLHEGTVKLKYGITALVSRSNGIAEVKFTGGDIKESLNKIGVMPLPPYIRRKADQSDVQHYQTVYAKKEGAIAAPTAGLHFTDKLLNTIKEKGVEIKTLTLHISYGTFKPVLSTDIEKHQMDEEFYEIPEATTEAVNCAKLEGRRVIAVGTTVTRALEASAVDGLGAMIKAGTGKASIFIYPGYRFKIIDGLITNFHLPKSTPMMLTSAFSGLSLLKKAYSEAQKRGYRFFSYGDAMIII
jgi:S-adenosylmethionine:tRNA ribosyltransferase-isomerase